MSGGSGPPSGDRSLHTQIELEELYTELANIEGTIRLEKNRAEHIRAKINEIEKQTSAIDLTSD